MEYMIEYNIISTGSQGNAVVINKIVMIDCGVAFSKLTEVYKDLKIVLMTHKHSDHFKTSTIRKLAAQRPTLRWGCGEYLKQDLIDCGVDPKNIDVYKIGVKYNYGRFKFAAVKLYHNVKNVGYRLYFGAERAFYATDTCKLDGISAKNYDLYMVEANYEPDEIIERINEKKARGEYAYEINVLQNHLSRPDCDAWLAQNRGEKSKCVYMHQHRDEEGKAKW